MSKSVLILAHGILGFGSHSFFGLPNPIGKLKYFSDIYDSIDQTKLTVLEPTVDAIGSVTTRSNRLYQYILEKTKPTDKVHIIAHSMGGLDVMAALPSLQQKRNIMSIATIGTPFLGSEVADVIYNNIQGELLDTIPAVVTSVLRELGNEGLKDLTTLESAARIKTYNMPPAIPVILIAGNIVDTDNASLLFELAAVLGGINHDANDGVVKVSSAQPKNWKNKENVIFDPIWQLDHGGEIGWPPVQIEQNEDHIERYHRLIARLTGMDIADFAINNFAFSVTS